MEIFQLEDAHPLRTSLNSEKICKHKLIMHAEKNAHVNLHTCNLHVVGGYLFEL